MNTITDISNFTYQELRSLGWEKEEAEEYIEKRKKQIKM